MRSVPPMRTSAGLHQYRTMELQDIELTIDDILAVHRFWITRQYVIENKTEVEIVEELYRRQLVVSLAQLQQCIRRWNLTRPGDPKLSEYSQSYSYSISTDDQRHYPSSPSTPRTIPPVPNQDLYTDRPLPSLPPHMSSPYDDLYFQPSYTYHPSQPSPSLSPSPPRSHTYFTDQHLAQSHDAVHRLGTHSSADLEVHRRVDDEQDGWNWREARTKNRRSWSLAQDARSQPTTKKAVRKRIERREKDKAEDKYRDRSRD